MTQQIFPINVCLSEPQRDYLVKLIDLDMNTLRDLMVDDPQRWNDDFQLAKIVLEKLEDKENKTKLLRLPAWIVEEMKIKKAQTGQTIKSQVEDLCKHIIEKEKQNG